MKLDTNSTSRPGTPLCDEKPEHAYCSDPRKHRVPNYCNRGLIDLQLPSFGELFLASYRSRNPSSTALSTPVTPSPTYITPLTIKTLQTHNALLSQKEAAATAAAAAIAAAAAASVATSTPKNISTGGSTAILNITKFGDHDDILQQPKSPKSRSISRVSRHSSSKPISRSPSPDSHSSLSSLSSSSQKSIGNNIDEQLRKVDALYEQWKNESRVLNHSSDSNRKFEPKTELLSNYKPLVEFERKDEEPSQLVEMILSRPSIFDEDSKRLENVREKFKLKDFSQIKSSILSTTTTSSMINGEFR